MEISKDDGKTRPLNSYCYEDKLVQEALKRILEAVFEPHFYEEMMGFRPDRGCHRALRMLNGMIMYRTGYIVDADIRSFFDHMDHGWIIKFVESKIKDPNITRLRRRLLKAGIMNGHSYEETEEGSGQGSVCSPILSCIYMHYVLLWWFKEKIQPEMKGFCGNVIRSLFYWLNRRSQRKSYIWKRFLHMIDEAYPIVEGRVYVNLLS